MKQTSPITYGRKQLASCSWLVWLALLTFCSISSIFQLSVRSVATRLVIAQVALPLANIQEPRQVNTRVGAHLRSYVINMARSRERWASFNASIATSDLATMPLTRVSAIDADTITQSDLKALLTPAALQELRRSEKYGYRMAHYEVTKGAVGCYLSQMRALELAATQLEPFALIFEDDVRVPPDAHRLVEKTVACAGDRGGCDILLLDCNCWRCVNTNKCEGFKQVQWFTRLHAYIVTPHSAAKILALLRARSIRQHLDYELSCLASSGKITIICQQAVSFAAGFVQQKQMFASNTYTPLHASKQSMGFTPNCGDLS